MKSKVRMTRTLSFAIREDQMEKLKHLAAVTGVKISALVRMLIDSSVPDINPNDQFWRRISASGILRADLPKQAVVPFISSWLHLPLTGVDELDKIEIDQCPERGISPTMWAMERIRRAFYDKGVREWTSQQDESESTSS